jgi:hypothetical protein
MKLKYIYLKPLKKNEKRKSFDSRYAFLAFANDYQTNGTTKLAHLNHKK